jgi:hypothetical protein
MPYGHARKNAKFGFVLGQIEDMSHLTNPLLCGDGSIKENEVFNDLVNKLKIILKYNIIHNRWFFKYCTNFEKFEHRSRNVCTLSIEVVKCILEEHFLGQKPCEVESLGSIVESLSILLNINNGSRIIINKDYYIIGDVFNCVDCKRETFGVKYTRLQVDNH